VALNLEAPDVAAVRYAALISRMAKSQRVYFSHVASSLQIPEEIRQKHPEIIDTPEDVAEARMREIVTGTADRKMIAARSAGLYGFRLPPRASSETRELYAKVVNIAWVPAFEKSGNYGGHTGTAGQRFVQDYVAPLVFQEGPRFLQAGSRP